MNDNTKYDPIKAIKELEESNKKINEENSQNINKKNIFEKNELFWEETFLLQESYKVLEYQYYQAIKKMIEIEDSKERKAKYEKFLIAKEKEFLNPEGVPLF